MSFSTQKKDLKLYALILSFVLFFSPLLNASVTYAEDGSAPAQTDPAAPQNLRVVPDSITATGATIEWDIDPDINDIDVWNADNDQYLDWGNSGTRTISVLKPNTTYRLYITWFERPATIAHKSNIIEFTTIDGEVEAPPAAGAKNLKVISVTHNTVSLTWDPAPNVADYWIWDENNKYITWANDGKKTVGGLEANTTYTFYIGPDGIQAPNLTAEQKSNYVTFTTTEDQSEYAEAPLTPPQHLKVSAVTDSSVTLDWIGSPGADGYDLYVNGKWISGVWDGSNTITYTLTEEQMSASSIYFEVGAQDSINNKVSANSNKVTLTWGELLAPRDVQIVTSNRSTISLGWAPTSGATSYTIFKDGQQIGTSDTNRYTANNLTEGQVYSFAVVAKNNLWESPESVKITAVPGSNYNIVTYYSSWSVYETGRNFKPTDIDVSQVTHINYAFADLCWKQYGTGAAACQNEDIPLQKDYVYDGEIVIGDQEKDLENFALFASIKESNPHLKLIISVGGWSWSKNFSNMAATEETRRMFADSTVKFLREYELDGVDIDWEYPVEGGETYNVHRPEDKENFTLTMQTIREALDAAGTEDGKYYLLTIASGQGDNFVVNADLVNASKILDFINIMTYDYSGSWEMLAHHNAPLYADKNHPQDTAPRNNVNGGVLGHLNGGVPSHKLVLGIPFYGKGWSGCPENGEYATCTDFPAGTWEKGIFDYSDLENNFVNKDGYNRHWNEASKVAYLYNSENQTFITYNDPTSMKYNASLVKSLNLAGVMSWDISGDRNRTLSTQLVHDLPIDGIVDTSALPAPTKLTTTSIKQNAINIQWDAISEANDYEVFINNQYVGHTSDTKYSASSLRANTEYKIHVLATVKEEEQILKVSASSQVLTVKTAGSPSSVDGGLVTPPNKGKDELATTITKDHDKWIVNVDSDAAIKTIEASSSTSFFVQVSNEAKQVSILVSKEIIEAIAKKGEHATLTIQWNGISYNIPIYAIRLSADIRISIAAPEESVIDRINALTEKKGLKLLATPIDFNIEQLEADQSYTEITDFGKYLISRSFTLIGEDLNLNRTTGVVYHPDTDTFRSVPTKFTTNTDGTVTAELIRNGNSIYTLVESNFSFKDVTAEWLRKDVERATAKLIMSGETTEKFGVNSAITRAELISIIVKGLGILPDTASHPFIDVDTQSTYAGDIAVAKKLGLIKGTSETTFNPNGTITRQDLAVILANTLNYAGQGGQGNLATLSRFKDQDIISGYAKASVALVVEQRIMLGISPTTFDSSSKVTKAQAAVTIMRLLDALKLT